MKMAMIALTSYGVTLAKKIQIKYPTSVIYTTQKHWDSKCKVIQPNLSQLTKVLFEEEKIILYIMATGIVVRTIAPFLNHKSKDPAILVMDEKGQYVISLLSGHLGHANAFAKELAIDIGATPIITTSSDLNDVVAVDTFAHEEDCRIMDFKMAKVITALRIEKEGVATLSRLVDFQHLVDETRDPKGAIIISYEEPKLGEYGLEESTPIAWIVPARIVAGIGCRRGKDKEDIRQLLEDSLKMCGYQMESVSKIVSVELKADEIGLIELAKDLKIPFECLTIEELQKVEHRFEGSEFVKKTLGVANVSEPAGYLGSNKGQCLLPIQKRQGITLSLWEKNNDFIR